MSESTLTRRNMLQGAGMAGAAGLAATIGVGAFPNIATAASTENPGDALVGAWRGVATLTGLGSFETLLSFALGGTLVHSASLDLQNTPSAPNLSSPSYGAWKRTGPNQYAVKFEFFTFDAQTNPSGSGVVKEQLSVDDDKLTGAITVTLFDTGGNVIPPSDIPGTITANRIEAG